MAVNETAPAVVGVHARLNGAATLVPIDVAFARYCTLVTVVPAGVDDDEVIVVVALIGTVALAAGEVMETVGAIDVLTVTERAVLVLTLPTVSVARAVIEYVPPAVGVQDAE